MWLNKIHGNQKSLSAWWKGFLMGNTEGVVKVCLFYLICNCYFKGIIEFLVAFSSAPTFSYSITQLKDHTHSPQKVYQTPIE